MLSDRLTALLRNPETPTWVLRDAVQEEEEPVASVFIVEGHSGTYSDRTHWIVAAYLEREAAEALAERLRKWCSETNCGMPDPDEWDYDKRQKPPEDPTFRYVYDGVHYVVGEIPLRVEEGA